MSTVDVEKYIVCHTMCPDGNFGLENCHSPAWVQIWEAEASAADILPRYFDKV